MKYFVFILLLLFIGCEEKQTTINDFSVPTFSSNIKPAIGGVEYVTSSGVEGVTDQSGEFTYNLNDNITFKLGNIILGKLNTNTINSNNYLSLFEILEFQYCPLSPEINKFPNTAIFHFTLSRMVSTVALTKQGLSSDK